MLTTDSLTYFSNSERTNYYYENIQVRVFKNGDYIFIINSTANAFASLYKTIFKPFDLSANLLLSHDERCGIYQLKFIFSLRSDETYVLVVTTTSSYIVSSFSVAVVGPSNINLSHTSECHYLLAVERFWKYTVYAHRTFRLSKLLLTFLFVKLPDSQKRYSRVFYKDRSSDQ